MEEQGMDQLLGSGFFSETLHSVAVTGPTPQSGSIMVLTIRTPVHLAQQGLLPLWIPILKGEACLRSWLLC